MKMRSCWFINMCLGEIRKLIRVVGNKGRRDKELEYKKQQIGERKHPLYGLEFLPMSIWEDSEGRQVHGAVGVKKGDLVVVVSSSLSPLILRRLKGAQSGKKGKECEWPEYNIVSWDGRYTGTRISRFCEENEVGFPEDGYSLDAYLSVIYSTTI